MTSMAINVKKVNIKGSNYHLLDYRLRNDKGNDIEDSIKFDRYEELSL